MQLNTSNILTFLVLISIFGAFYGYIKMSKKLIDWSRKEKQKKKQEDEKFQTLKNLEKEQSALKQDN